MNTFSALLCLIVILSCCAIVISQGSYEGGYMLAAFGWLFALAGIEAEDELEKLSRKLLALCDLLLDDLKRFHKR